MPSASNHPDRRLIGAIRRGDASALDALIDRYWEPLVTYAARLLGDWESAQDLAQETFVRIWERREAWSAEGSVQALLYQIIRNLALDELKSVARRSQYIERYAGKSTRLPTTPVEEIERTQLESAFVDALAALPERRREVYVLARVEGFSYSHIAQVLGISPQTVANHLSAALASLRKQLQHFLDPRDGGASSSAGGAPPQ